MTGTLLPAPGPVEGRDFPGEVAARALDANDLGAQREAGAALLLLSDGQLAHEEPTEAVSFASGVICCPENYAGQEPEPEGVLRLTLMANAERWNAMEDGAYAAAKEDAWSTGLDSIAAYGADIRGHVVAKDVFTPRTIEHFTGHLNGAVYGCPHKDKSGTTPLEGLFLCGTDQGYLGIVGAMLSGVAMANRHALLPA